MIFLRVGQKELRWDRSDKPENASAGNERRSPGELLLEEVRKVAPMRFPHWSIRSRPKEKTQITATLASATTRLRRVAG